VVVEVNARPERLGATAAREQTRQRLYEGPSAICTAISPTMNDEHTWGTKAVEVTSTATVVALAAEAYASAARASKLDASSGSDVDVELILALASEHPISFNVDSVIHRGHGGGSPRLMSPFFDQEPDIS